MGNRIADLHLARGLDTRNDVTHIPGTQFGTRHHLHLEHTDFIGIILFARIEELHFVALTDDAVHNLEVSDDAPEGVEHGVENQSLQRGFLLAHRMGDTLNDGGKNLFHAHARLARSADNLFTLAAQQLHDFIFHLIRIGTCHVTLVDDRNNLQIVFYRHVEVGYGLRLHALRGVHNEQRAFAGGNGARHLVGEIHVSRGVNQIQNILFLLIHILHLYGMAFDGDTPLFFKVHVIQHLSFSHLYGIGKFQQPIRQGRFAVVDVGNNAKVAYILHCQ